MLFRSNKMVRWREKRIFTGHAPYGYVWDKKKCEFKIRKREETVLNKILNMYVKLGMSMKDLVIQLNEDGYKSRRAKWSTGTLSGILKNPCYNTCKLVTNAHVYVDGKRTKQKKDESEWIIYDLPRIVSKSLWEQVEKKRHFNVRKQKRTTWQQEFWLREDRKSVV